LALFNRKDPIMQTQPRIIASTHRVVSLDARRQQRASVSQWRAQVSARRQSLEVAQLTALVESATPELISPRVQNLLLALIGVVAVGIFLAHQAGSL
jgi:hypothetical protein